MLQRVIPKVDQGVVATHNRCTIAAIRHHIVFIPESSNNKLLQILWISFALSCARRRLSRAFLNIVMIGGGIWVWASVEVAFFTLDRNVFLLAVLVEEFRHGIGHYLSLITMIDPESHE